jgi:hypothetical protein
MDDYMDDKKIALRLNNKKQTGFGIASFALSIISLLLFVSAVLFSAFANRGANNIIITIGLLEIVGAISCLIGIIYGAIGEFSKDMFRTYAHLGIGINSVLMMFHLLVLIYGYGF